MFRKQCFYIKKIKIHNKISYHFNLEVILCGIVGNCYFNQVLQNVNQFFLPILALKILTADNLIFVFFMIEKHLPKTNTL